MMDEDKNKFIELTETISFDDIVEYFDKEVSWTYKDIPNFYERVRLALGAVSEVILPDYYIDMPEKAPFAETYVKSKVKSWVSLPDDKFKIFESIIVYQTAALLQSVVANKMIKKKAIPTITLQYGDLTTSLMNGMSLEDMVEYLLAELNGENTRSSFIGFRVTDSTDSCSLRIKGEWYDRRS